MQPQYEIRRSEEFAADVTAICGDLATFDAAFEGFAWFLMRLPRGPGTWDLSVTGDLRLASLPAIRLENGTEVPQIYFTFRLHLGPAPHIELLRAMRADDVRLHEVLGLSVEAAS